MQSQVLDINHWKVEETGGRGSRTNQPRVMALESYEARLASAVPWPYPAGGVLDFIRRAVALTARVQPRLFCEVGHTARPESVY